jgi:hypothetical protein
MDGRMRKKFGMLAVSMTQDRNCEDTAAETKHMNDEQRLVKLNKGL